jgi:hypothetical protein
MSGTIRSKGNMIILVQKLLAGLDKHYAGQSLTINGTAVAVTDIGTQLQGYLNKMSTADGTKTLWQQQLQSARADEPDIEATVVAIHGIVRGNLGASNPALTDFGIKPKAPSKRTAAEKAETAEKSAATRAARHTTGPKAKLAIHGTAPASPEPAPQAPAVKPKTE